MCYVSGGEIGSSSVGCLSVCRKIMGSLKGKNREITQEGSASPEGAYIPGGMEKEKEPS